jgi:hypothetical protein
MSLRDAVTAPVRPAIIVAILWASTSHADDALTLRAHGEDAEPLLHVDPMFAPMLETPFAAVQSTSTRFDLGRATSAVLASERWIDTTTDARGFTAGLHVSHNFGFATLIAFGSAGQVESRFGSGSYLDIGLALAKTLRLSRWTIAWLSLGLEYHAGMGQPGGTALMARVGFTFR